MGHILSSSYEDILVSSLEWLNNYMGDCLYLDFEILCDADTGTVTVY